MARDELIVGIGADISDLQRELRRGAHEIESLDKLFAQPLNPPPPNFSEWIQAADVVRAEFDTIISANQVGQRAAAAAKAGADALRTGFLARLGQLRTEVTLGLISPKDFAAQADLAMEAFSLEIATKQALIPPISLRATVATTGPNVIDPDELRAAEEAFDRVTASTNQATVASQWFQQSTARVTKGVNQIRSGLAQYSAIALGARSSTASLAQGLLFGMGAGSGTVIGVLAGITLISEGYKLLTADSRKAKEEALKHTEALKRLRDEQREPLRVAQEQTSTEAQKAEQLRQEIGRIAALQAAAIQTNIDKTGAGFAQAEFFVNRLVQLGREFLEASSLASAGTVKVGQVAADVDEARIDRLTTLLSLGAAQRTEEEQLARVLAASRAELARTSATDEKGQQRRLVLLQRIAEIESAQKEALELDTKPAVEAAKALREEVQATAGAFQQAQEAASALGAPVELRLDVADALDAVRALQGQVDAMITQFQRLGVGTSDLEGLRDQLRGIIAEADPSGLERTTKAVEGLISRLGALREGLGGVAGQQDAIKGSTAALVIEYGNLIAAIDQQGGALTANAELLRQAGEAVAALGPESAPFTAGLADAITKLREAEARLREFAALGLTLPEFQTQLVVDVDTARAQVAAFLAESQDRLDQRVFKAVLDIEISEDPTSFEFMIDALRATGAEGRKLAKALQDPRDQAEKLRDAMIDVADSTAAFRDIAHSLGLIGEEGDKALQAIEGLAEASARFASGDILGGIIGGITSIAGLAGGDQQEQERDRILAENNERLQELTLALNENAEGAAGLDATRKTVQALLNAPELLDRVQRNDQSIFNKGRFEDEVEAFEAILRGAGVSLEELDAIARKNGIQLLDDEGRILAEAFRQLIPVLNEAIREMTHFGISISDQRLIAETRDAIAGDSGGTQAALERERQILLDAVNLDPVFEEMVRNLDLSTKEGQAAFREAIKKIFEMGLEGFDPTELVGDTTATDVLQIVKGIADGLNELAEATEKATDQMLNVPTGFKIAAARFAAEAAEIGREFGDALPGSFKVIPMAEASVVETAPSQTAIGEVNINIDGRGKDTQQLAKDVVRELRNLSQAKFGTTDRWGEL